MLLLVLFVATWLLALSEGKNINELIDVFGDAVKDVALILLTIAGSCAFKQVPAESGVSN